MGWLPKTYRSRASSVHPSRLSTPQPKIRGGITSRFLVARGVRGKVRQPESLEEGGGVRCTRVWLRASRLSQRVNHQDPWVSRVVQGLPSRGIPLREGPGGEATARLVGRVGYRTAAGDLTYYVDNAFHLTWDPDTDSACPPAWRSGQREEGGG